MIHKLPPADVQTDLTALRGELLAEGKRCDSFHATMGTGYHVAAQRLTDLLGSLPVPDTEERLRLLIGTWMARARDAAKYGVKLPQKSHREYFGSVNAAFAISECADELSALLSRSAQEPPKAGK